MTVFSLQREVGHCWHQFLSLSPITEDPPKCSRSLVSEGFGCSGELGLEQITLHWEFCRAAIWLARSRVWHVHFLIKKSQVCIKNGPFCLEFGFRPSYQK